MFAKKSFDVYLKERKLKLLNNKSVVNIFIVMVGNVL